MKVREVPRSGKRGPIVAFRGRYGQCERQHTTSTKPRTAAQQRSQAKFGAASAGWNYLTEDQRTAWRAYAREVDSHPQGGQCGPLTGQVLYTAINRNQAALGLPPFDYPPERPQFAAHPVVGFRITQARGRVALKLTLSKAPVAFLLVFASRPYNEGREYCDKFRYIGPLPRPTGNESDISAQYRRHYPAPWPGSRVILRIVQQINGWRTVPHRIDAIFPRIPEPPSAASRRPTASATR